MSGGDSSTTQLCTHNLWHCSLHITDLCRAGRVLIGYLKTSLVEMSLEVLLVPRGGPGRVCLQNINLRTSLLTETPPMQHGAADGGKQSEACMPKQGNNFRCYG